MAAKLHSSQSVKAFLLNKIMEIFKDIPNYNGDYQASNLGRIRSFKKGGDLILKGGVNGVGYKTVSLYNGKFKTCTIHVLVAICFLNHKPCGHKLVVDHIDGNKLNNTLDNLRIITNRKNTHANSKGSSKHRGVSWSKAHNKWRSSIHVDGVNNHLGFFNNELEAGAAYQIAIKELKN